MSDLGAALSFLLPAASFLLLMYFLFKYLVKQGRK